MKTSKVLDVVKYATVLFSAVGFLGCEKSNRDAVQLTFEIRPAQHEKMTKLTRSSILSQRGVSPDAPITPFAPATVPEFDCIFINVMGDGIGEWSANKTSVTASSGCGYAGSMSDMISVQSGGTALVKVSPGSGRVIQILGVRSKVGCRAGLNASDLQKTDSFPGIFELGRATIDVYSDQEVPIASSYSVRNAVDTRCKMASQLVGLDSASPVVGGDISATPGGTTISLSWPAAIDNGTSSVNLKYKVVRANLESELTNLASAQNATTAMDWTENATEGLVGDLSPGGTYAFAVLVKDAAGNVSLYSPITSSTTTGTTYSVTYDGHGNSGGSVTVDMTTYQPGVTVTVLDNLSLVKSGYAFVGWNTLADGTGTFYVAGNTFSISGNTTLYAQWSPRYNVTYDGNGNTSGSIPVDASGYASSSTVTVSSNSGVLAKTGFAFNGWNTAANGSGVSLAAASTFSISGNVTLYAQWSPRYTITYSGNTNTGGSAPSDSSTYASGATATVLGNTGSLVKSGTAFEGWTTQADGSGAFYDAGGTFEIVGHTTLYAKWAARYAMTYDGNGSSSGSVPTDDAGYSLGQVVTVLGNTGGLLKSGYAFEGWTTQADGSGSFYDAGGTFEIVGHTTLYAKWAARYAMTYDGNGSTSGTVPTDNAGYNPGVVVTVLGNTGGLLKTGYAFEGWTTHADGTGAFYDGGGTFEIVGNTTLYAKWSPRYTVTYAGNGSTGGSVPVDTGAYSIGNTVTVLGNTGTLLKTGFYLAAWNTQANGSGTDYAEAATFTLDGDITLYAKWQAAYTVTYDGNGSTGGSVPVDTMPYLNGDTAVVLGNTGNLTKAGVAFIGWNTVANGTGTAYVDSDPLPMSAANVTLYAQWQTAYTITYNGNASTGGTVPVDGTLYLSSDTITVLGNTGGLTKGVSGFAGWTLNSAGTGTVYAANSTLTISANTTLYAKWNTGYLITYDGNTNTGGTVPVDATRYVSGAIVTALDNTGGLSNGSLAFGGWNTLANGLGTSVSVGGTFSCPAANTTLYAQWVTAFPLTYNGNGNTSGSAPTDPSFYGAGVGATVLDNPVDMIKTGYAFTGWNTAADGSGVTYYGGNILPMLSGGVTLYAQWESANLRVTYNANSSTSGIVPVDSGSYANGSVVTFLKNSGNLIRTNYRWLGWNTSSIGTGTSYSAGDTIVMGSSNVTVYANWSAIPAGQYYVTYNENGATSGSVPVDTAYYANGTTVTVVDNLGGLAVAGKSFTGWNTKADGTGTTYVDTNTLTIASANVNLYAQFATAQTYKITYNANGGSGTTPTDGNNYLDGSKVTTSMGSSLSFTGKVLMGWNTAAAGTGDQYALGEVFQINAASLTLYAVWASSTKYTVTYDVNTGTGTAPTDSNTYYTTQNATILSGAGLSKTNYVFMGWNTSSASTGTTYTEGATMPIAAANVTLYAIWGSVRYVATTGNNTNAGTASAPLLTISTAITQLNATSAGGEIRVAGGSYTLTSGLSLKTNIRLLGGYDISTPASPVRNIATNTTTLISGYTGTSTFTFLAISSLAGQQMVDGITFMRKSGVPASISVNGISVSSSPNTIISNNTFYLAAGSGKTVTPISISGKTYAYVSGNKIEAVDGGYQSCKIYGIAIKSSTTGSYFSLVNNVVNVGIKFTNTCSGGTVQAIDVGTSSGRITAYIRNNTILAGAKNSSATTYGFGIKKSTSNPSYKLYFDNNIVFGPTGQTSETTYGFYCYSSAYCNLQSMRANNFFSLKTFAKLASSYTSTTSLERAYSVARSNINVEMVSALYFANVGSKNYRLSSSAPTSVVSGGLDGSALSWGYANDADLASRSGDGTTGWSMGAYEY